MIRSWKDYFDAWFEEDEDGVRGVNRDLRPEMSERFRRRHDRIELAGVQRVRAGGYRRYIEVTARKHRARRRRRK